MSSLMQLCKYRTERYSSYSYYKDENGNAVEEGRGTLIPAVDCECGGQPHLRVAIPGTILCPWDADFVATYCGPEWLASELRIAMSEYYAAVAKVDRLSCMKSADQRAFELVAVELPTEPVPCPSCGYEQLCPDCGTCHCGAAPCGAKQ